MTRAEHNPMFELDAYDNMGIQYYYGGNLDKAMYYHHRMMAGIIEEETNVKAWNIGLLERDRRSRAFKESNVVLSIFALYREAKKTGRPFLFPHEDETEFAPYSSLPPY